MSFYIGKNENELELIGNRCDKALVIDTLRKYMTRYIGSIRLLAIKNIPTIELNKDSSNRYISKKDSFDGWVLLDGSLFDKTVFKDAYDVFLNRYGEEGNFFRIPNTSDFFKLNNKNIDISNIDNAVSYIPDHQHKVNTEITIGQNGVVKNAFKMCWNEYTGYDGIIHNPSNITNRNIRVGKGSDRTPLSELLVGGRLQGYYPGAHWGSSGGYVHYSDVIFNTSASFTGVPVGYIGNNPVDSYPKHNKLIAIMYIGF